MAPLPTASHRAYTQKSAKGSYKITREASKQKKKGRTVAGENSISEGGAPAAAASPEPAAAAAATATSPLKRWLGFGGRKKASPPSSPAKETKTTNRTKMTNKKYVELDVRLD